MQIRARKDFPLCVDCVVKSAPPGLVAQDVTGAKVAWFGDGFSSTTITLEATTGRVRFRASPEYMATLTPRVYDTNAYVRINNVTHVFPVVLVVTESDVLVTTPDPGHHQGALGSVDDSLYRLEFSSGELAAGGGGAPGPAGAAGDTGWSPVLAVVTDGTRRVLQVTSWEGGTGTPPASGDYVGPSGLVGSAAAAVDVRGAPGADGADGVGATPDAFQTVVFGGTSLVADSPTDTLNVVAGAGISVTGNAGTDTGTVTNTGVLSVAAGAGVSVSGPTGAVTVANTGVTSLTAGAGLSLTGATGAVTATNMGVRTLTAGTGVSVGGTAQDRTVSANVISVNGSVGALATPNAFTTFKFSGTDLLPDVLQDTLTFTATTGISFTPNAGTDSVAVNNTGVTSVVAGTGIAVSAATGATTISSLGPAKSACSVLGAASSTSSSSSPLLLSGQSIVVPAGGKVNVDARLLFRTAAMDTGIYYGFHLTQGGVFVPDGPDVSYGSFDFDIYTNVGPYTYDTTNLAIFKGGYISAKAGTVNFLHYTLHPVVVAGEMGHARASCTMYNGGAGTLTIQMFVLSEVAGSSVTAEKGSSFYADVVVG